MAFTGDLEHLPIVDLIQLMNSTRKTGLLSVRGKKGESQLVFKDGYIVSASHLDNSTRIGDVLLELGVLTADQINQGLKQQSEAGDGRRPLAITLIDMELLTERDAHRALQKLIELTVVEILTWKSGKFVLEHLKDTIDCDFRYYPQKMDHEINVNTQSILLDALRIFDEKKRDGLIHDEHEDPDDDIIGADELISEDDLGLSALDELDDMLRKPVSAVVPFDPLTTQLKRIAALAPELSEAERSKLARFLIPFTNENSADNPPANLALMLQISDQLLRHALLTSLAASGIAPVDDSQAAHADFCLTDSIMNISATGIPSICLTLPKSTSILEAYGVGARGVMPLPAEGESYVNEVIMLLEVLPGYLKSQR